MAEATSDSEFQLVPKTTEDITSEWCEKVLQKGECIGAETKVSGVKVEDLTSKIGDVEIKDGGGLSGAMIIKLKLSYE